MNHYPQMDYMQNVHPHKPFDIEETLIVAVLKNSHGQPTMSDEDVKLALLSLFNTCKTQQNIIDELVECVNDLRTPKKRGWKFWIRLK